MSHFTCLVVLPISATTEAGPELDRELASLLEPYNKNWEVEAYATPCECVGHAARVKAQKMRERLMALRGEPSLNELLQRFAALPSEAQTDQQWESMIRPHRDLERQIWRERFSDEFRNQPNADCPRCGGAGERTTTYNPNSKWDWWRIGGRWDGVIKGLDVAEERRDDERDINLAPLNEQPENNRARLGDLLSGDELLFTPFAVLTPDGAWHDPGQMGWWGIVTNAATAADWEATVRLIYQRYANHTGIVVDCHI